RRTSESTAARSAWSKASACSRSSSPASLMVNAAPCALTLIERELNCVDSGSTLTPISSPNLTCGLVGRATRITCSVGSPNSQLDASSGKQNGLTVKQRERLDHLPGQGKPGG